MDGAMIPQFQVTKNQRLAEFNLAKASYVEYQFDQHDTNKFINFKKSVLSLCETLTYDVHHLKNKDFESEYNKLIKDPFDMNKIEYYTLYKMCHLMLYHSGLLNLDTKMVDPMGGWSDN